MIKNKNYHISFYTMLVGIALVILLSQCNPIKKIGDKNLAHLYNTEKRPYRPDFNLYQYDIDSTQLFFSVNTQELLYKTFETEQNKIANFSIHYKLYDNWNSKTIVDSSTFFFSDTITDEPNGMISGSMKVYSPLPEGKVLSVVMTDMNRNISTENIFYLSGNSTTGQNYYKIVDNSGTIIHSNHLNTNQQFRIKPAFIIEDGMWVRYYNRNFPVAYPPFAVVIQHAFDFMYDSLFFVPFNKEGTNELIFDKPGIYHFQNDTTAKAGYTLFVYDRSYPAITAASQMINPLRYITTSKEFDKIKNHTDPKSAVDKFWIEIAGSPERARNLIRDYYLRIEDANRFFCSYLEGWKTDRGMIYVIFGPPDIVYRNENSEVWTYGETGSMLSINMLFHKVENPFSNNDYVLERSTAYRTSWYTRVNTWRR